MKFRIYSDSRDALRMAHYRAMFMIPEEVTSLDHEENSFFVESHIDSTDTDETAPFIRWCESLGEVKVETLD